MSTDLAPVNELNPRRSRRGVVGVLAAGAVTLLGIPAALAAVWSINEVKSDWTLTDCLSKVEGTDAIDFGLDPADDFYIAFDPTTTHVDATTGEAVLQETLSVRVPAGFRTFSTDTFHVRAKDCGHDFDVRLRVDDTNSFGEAAVAGNWSDKYLKMYLSTVPAPNDDFTSTDWDQNPLLVNTAGTVVNDATLQATLSDNSDLVIGFELAGNAPAAATGYLNFQVEFVPR